MDVKIGAFIANVMKTLQENGFPANKVSLPLEKMYEIASEKGLSFNKVLEFLKEKGIDHEKTNEKIIFFKRKVEEGKATVSSAAGDMFEQAMGAFNPEMLKNVNLGDVMSQASEMMKNMTPEQLKEIKSMAENMTKEQKDELMKKFKNMF